MKRTSLAMLSVVLSAAVVLPSLHVVLRPAPETYVRTEAGGPPAMARELLSSELASWEGGERAVDRAVNPEWDLGHHTFFALSLANLALEPSTSSRERERHRERIDAVLAELRSRPTAHYHLPYFQGEFRGGEPRSLFFDGEVLLVLAARLAIWPDPAGNVELEQRARTVVAQMSASPSLMGESYPNECWMFDNSLALAALAVAEQALGHGVPGADDLTRAWLARAPRLVDPHTGLLVASATWEGATLDGPEGSSAFAVAHFLELVDPVLARQQYERARSLLVTRPLGFAYAREWPDPAAWGADPLPPRAGKADVDSGPIVPLLRASAGASGMAILGAASFHDDALLGELVTSLELAAFPERDREKGGLRFLASNAIGDAVMLYAMTQGPLWRRVKEGRSAS
jgi:hypothetical protein